MKLLIILIVFYTCIGLLWKAAYTLKQKAIKKERATHNVRVYKA